MSEYYDDSDTEYEIEEIITEIVKEDYFSKKQLYKIVENKKTKLRYAKELAYNIRVSLGLKLNYDKSKDKSIRLSEYL